MRVRSLQVDRIPGIDRPFEIDALGRGAVLVVGPNGSGKSRTGLTIAALLFPEKARELEEGRATAVVEHGDDRFESSFVDGSLAWRREGGDRLADPAEGRAHAFHLPARSLWRTEGHDDFGRELARRVAGGYDLDAVEEEHKVSSRVGSELGKQVREARRAVERAVRELDALAREEESVESLERQRREAHEAELTAVRLRNAKEAARARRELAAAEARLAAFPAELEHARADSLKELERVESEWHTAESRATDAQRAARESSAASARLAGGVDEEGVRTARERLENARRADDRAAQAREDLARAEAALAAARRASGLSNGTHLPTPESLGEVEVLARNEASTRGQLDEVERRLGVVAGSSALASRGRHVAFGAILTAVGAALAVTVDVWFAALGGFGLGWLGRALATDGRDRLTLRVQRDELVKKLDELTARGAQLRANLGLAADTPSATLLESFSVREKLRKLLEDRDGQDSRVAEVERRREEALAGVAEALGLGSPPADVAAAQARLETAERSLEERRRAQARTESDTRDADAAATEAERARTRRAEAFARLRLEPGDLGGAEALLAQRDAYERQRSERHELVGTQREALARLEEAKHLADLSDEELDRRLEREEQRAKKREELSENIAAIRTRVEQARADDPWQAAATERDTKEREARELFEEQLVRLCAQHLVKDVRKEHKEKSSPRVMRRSDELLGRFTRGRYRIELGLKSRLCALDGETGKRMELDELSDGTRVQLLLAVRLAFAETLEAPGEKLPWILDEAFGAADGDRLRELVGTVLEVASEGRQIVYLSAHPAEAALWTQIARERQLPQPQVVDLAEVRGLARSKAEQVAAALPERRRLPEPAGLSESDWARAVRADAPRRFDAPERLHVYHLLREDREALRRLVEDGIERLGVVENAPAATAAALGDEAREAPRGASGVARAVVEAWHVGRGRPIERADLRASGVKSDYFEPLAALAKRFGDDARAMLAALEDKTQRKDLLGKAMRDTTLEKIATALEERGVVDSNEPLDRAAVIGRGLAEAQKHGRTLEKGEAAQLANALVDHLEASAAVEETVGATE
ncbi:MAG: hypothetical protein R3F34_12595 [Planctomycetota bacterium]